MTLDELEQYLRTVVQRDSLAQPSPFRTVPTISATGTDASPIHFVCLCGKPFENLKKLLLHREEIHNDPTRATTTHA